MNTQVSEVNIGKLVDGVDSNKDSGVKEKACLHSNKTPVESKTNEVQESEGQSSSEVTEAQQNDIEEVTNANAYEQTPVYKIIEVSKEGNTGSNGIDRNCKLW